MNNLSYLVAPKQINTNAHFWGAFGHMETEISANWIVRFCQVRGKGWAPFSREELEAFYHQSYPGQSFWFNQLMTPDYRYIVVDEQLTVTPLFVEKCYAAAPNVTYQE